MRLARLVILVAALLAPADALAGVVKLRQGCVSGAGLTNCFPGHVVFRAAPGEANSVSVIEQDGGTTEVRDSANPIDLRTRRCKLYDQDHVAVCRTPEYSSIVYLGDGDDALYVQGEVDAWGGGGNDAMYGSSLDDQFDGDDGDDLLVGGNAADVLDGGRGSDRVEGGPGPDTIVDGETDAEAAPDFYDGGPAEPYAYDFIVPHDTINYSPRTAPLTIDLGTTKSMEDTITSIEAVVGGSGDDRLIAGPEGAAFEGGAGDDLLVGGPGPDELNGDQGSDTIDGGGGDDRLTAYQEKGTTETIVCGDGVDTADVFGFPLLGADCEALGVYQRLTVIPTLVDGEAIFGLAKSDEGVVSLRGRDGVLFGRARFDGKEIEVPLTPAGRGAVAAGAPVRIQYKGFASSFRYTVFLRAP